MCVCERNNNNISCGARRGPHSSRGRGPIFCARYSFSQRLAFTHNVNRCKQFGARRGPNDFPSRPQRYKGFGSIALSDYFCRRPSTGPARVTISSVLLGKTELSSDGHRSFKRAFLDQGHSTKLLGFTSGSGRVFPAARLISGSSKSILNTEPTSGRFVSVNSYVGTIQRKRHLKPGHPFDDSTVFRDDYNGIQPVDQVGAERGYKGRSLQSSSTCPLLCQAFPPLSASGTALTISTTRCHYGSRVGHPHFVCG